MYSMYQNLDEQELEPKPKRISPVKGPEPGWDQKHLNEVEVSSHNLTNQPSRPPRWVTEEVNGVNYNRWNKVTVSNSGAHRDPSPDAEPTKLKEEKSEKLMEVQIASLRNRSVNPTKGSPPAPRPQMAERDASCASMCGGVLCSHVHYLLCAIIMAVLLLGSLLLYAQCNVQSRKSAEYSASSFTFNLTSSSERLPGSGSSRATPRPAVTTTTTRTTTTTTPRTSRSTRRTTRRGFYFPSGKRRKRSEVQELPADTEGSDGLADELRDSLVNNCTFSLIALISSALGLLSAIILLFISLYSDIY